MAALLLLDIEKAFDSVWIGGLIYKLKTYKHTPLYKLLYSYLKDRQIQVCVGQTISPF